MNTSYEVRSNLFALKRRLEIETDRSFQWSEIADATGLHYNTLYKLANDRTGGVTFDTLARLLHFFRAEGLDITIGDLFVVSER